MGQSLLVKATEVLVAGVFPVMVEVVEVAEVPLEGRGWTVGGTAGFLMPLVVLPLQTQAGAVAGLLQREQTWLGVLEARDISKSGGGNRIFNNLKPKIPASITGEPGSWFLTLSLH